MYGGVLPYAVHRGKVYFLLGKEATHAGFADSRKWSDFGGGVEDGEDVKRGASREAFEESMGFLGSVHEIQKQLRHAMSAAAVGRGRCYLMRIPYDEGLPHTFHNVYLYSQYACPSGVAEGAFEKTHALWMSSGKLLALAKDANVDTRIKLRPIFARFVRENLRTAFVFSSGKVVASL